MAVWEVGGTCEAWSGKARAVACGGGAQCGDGSGADRTGEAEDDAPDNPLSGAVSVILAFVNAAVAQYLTKGGGDPLANDMVESAKNHIRGEAENLRKQRQACEKAAALHRRIEAKMIAKHKGVPPVLKTAMAANANSFAIRIAETDKQIKAHEDALVMLAGYTYDFDQPRFGQSQRMFMYGIGS